MRRLAVALVLCAGICACSPLLSGEDARRAYAEVDDLLARGEISPQQATWRREDIARMESFYAFDLDHATTLIGLLVGAGGLATGVTRLHRGAKRDPQEWAVLRSAIPKVANGGGGASGGGG